MRRLVLVASAVIPIAIIGLFLSNDSKAQAGTGAARGAPPRISTSAVRATDTLTLPYQIYLPFACRNFPPLVQVPEGEYLFVEYWTHSVLGVSCAGLCIDFPAYYFDPQSGKLAIYTTLPPEPALVLDDDDIGFVGSGTSLGGVGGGASGSLTKIQQCPSSEDGITLHYVDETGAITVEREDKVIVLEPYEVWVSDEEVETWDWLGVGCVVTSTHYITNYAFQDRDKIVYSSHVEVKRSGTARE